MKVTENGLATGYNKRASGARWKSHDRATRGGVVEVDGRHVDLDGRGPQRGGGCEQMD